MSRGGTKLAGALDVLRGRRGRDVVPSTSAPRPVGSPTACSGAGATHVVAIDVGRGQLAWTLRNDPRVTVMERTNVRELEAGAVDPPADICVADLSFISLRTVTPNLLALTTADAEFVLLVKPQFEAGRKHVGKGGIVREPVGARRGAPRDRRHRSARCGLGVRALVDLAVARRRRQHRVLCATRAAAAEV